MRIALLSDIHANVTALNAVLKDIEARGRTDAFALIGDLVNYGPRPNETIAIVRSLALPVLVNLWGNHEYSLFGGDLERFATDRGRSVLAYTNSILSGESRLYLKETLESKGFQELELEGRLVLFVHGNIDDPYWGKFGVDKMSDDRFAKYDYVISGHSHIPHYVEYFFSADNAEYRNKKRTVYINPGSVGQPRNHNPLAQYGELDLATGEYEHRCVQYDVEEEQKLFVDSVDPFYRERIKIGI